MISQFQKHPGEPLPGSRVYRTLPPPPGSNQKTDGGVSGNSFGFLGIWKAERERAVARLGVGAAEERGNETGAADQKHDYFVAVPR